MRLENCTPHAVDIWNAQGTAIVKTIPRSGHIARLQESNEHIGTADGVPICKTTYGDVYDLPEPEEGTLFIVSIVVRRALPERSDLVFPVELVRDDEGHIIGCRSLGR